MGVEWHIGCLKCKKFIWLGSQKPFSFKGFQIGNQNVKRFLYLHSECDKNEIGNLLLTSDGIDKTPWISNENTEWKEDILSRSFCFDSLKIDTINDIKNIICANCGKAIETNKHNIKSKDLLLKKGDLLWFCDEDCFDKYVEYNQEERDHLIYDSTNDAIKISTNSILHVACTICKKYVILDDKKISNSLKRDFEYLGLFLCEHIGHEHKIRTNNDLDKIYNKDFTEYKY